MANHLGNLFIVAAPSGGGKTSLVKKLVQTLDKVEVSISHTTRMKRPGEQHGVHYFFINDIEFNRMIEEGAFLEHATVFDHLYGTSLAQITQRLQEGIDVILDIDWQGAEQIRVFFPNVVTIFIVPPSMDALKERLLNRRQDKDEVISNRMQKAKDELSHYPEFDYLIINDNFEKAALELGAVVIADRLRTKRQVNKQSKLLSFLMSSQ